MRYAVILFLYLAAAGGASGASDAALWAEARENIQRGRFAAADSAVVRILDRARSAGDAAPWTRALIEHSSLRASLDAPETALRELRTAPWPDDPFARSLLELHYARKLKAYQRRYAHDIRQREAVVGADSLAYDAWDVGRIAAEIDAAMRRAWRLRDAWDADGWDWREFLSVGTFPEEIRGTPRDAMAYLWTAYLADTALWTPGEENAAAELDLDALMTAPLGAGGAPAPDADGAGHPLQRLGHVLTELRAWHLAHGRMGAALEAELENLRRLHQVHRSKKDRERITVYLQTRLAELPAAEPWWSLGKWQQASFLRSDRRPDALVRAHLAAVQGERRHPDSVGGRLCAAVLREIEAPVFSLDCQTLDGPGRRTIRIRHRNLPQLRFRAWRYDVVEAWEASADRPRRQGPAELPAGPPDLVWTVDLPPTPDYRDHVTWTGLPECPPGGYIVAASPEGDPRDEDVAFAAVDLVIGDLLLVAQSFAGEMEIQVRSARDGAPLPDVAVRLRERRRGETVESMRRTDAQGRVSCRADGGLQWVGACAVRGAHAAALDRFAPRHFGGGDRRREVLVYTDRGVYRPGQTVHWKVVAYDANAERTDLRVAAGCPVEVALRDANNEVVAERTVETNDFGSASGTFVLPPDRLRGRWQIVTDPQGYAVVRVEEYKRPTFTAELADPDSILVPGEPVHVTGRARYLFGAPVADAPLAWRVRRSAHVWSGWQGRYGGGEIVAEGRAVTGADGRFAVDFAAAPGPDAEDGAPQLQAYTVEADVTDRGGETRSARRVYLLGSTGIVAALDGGRGFLTAGVPDSLTVVRTDLQQVPRAGTGRWTLRALVPPARTQLPSEQPDPPAGEASLFATAGDSLRPRWDARRHGPWAWRTALGSWPRGETVASGTVRHGDDGRAVIAVTAPAPGAYLLAYETEDDRGRPSRVFRTLIAGGAGGADGLRLPLVVAAASPTVAPGDTVRILVHSGLSSCPVRVQVFVADRRVRDEFLPAGLPGGRILALPSTAEMHRGLTVAASVVRDHEVVRAQAKVGVPWSEKELKVEFASFRDRLRPGGRSSFTVRVTGPDGLAPDAEVLALMVDRSLEAIAPHGLPDPLQRYAGHAFAFADATTLEHGRRVLGRRPPHRWPDPPLLRPGGLVPFPGSGVELGLGRFGGVGRFSIDPEVRRRLARDGVILLEPFEVEGAEYMVEVKSAVQEHVVSSETFEKYAIDSVEGALSRQAGVVMRAGELYVRGGRSGEAPLGAPDGVLPVADLDAVQARQDFAETAFFLPHVTLDGEGAAVVEFRAPEAVTAWAVKVQAVTRDMRAGTATRTLRTAKDLLVRPYLPRFLREGDLAELQVVVTNAGSGELAGRLRLELEDAATGRDLAADFGLDEGERPFTAAPGGLTAVRFAVQAPAGPREVVVRVVGAAEGVSDGEQRALPILPGRTHLVQSRFAALGDSSRRELHFRDLATDDPTRVHDRLVVTVDTQLLTSVLRAVPSLVDAPYQGSEQTLDRYLAAGVLSAVYAGRPELARLAAQLAERDSRLERWDGPDPNRRLLLEESPWLRQAAGGADGLPLLNLLRPEVAAGLRDDALARLRQLQNADGGFPWFPGGRSTTHMTLCVLQGLARAAEFGLAVPADLAGAAWRHVHRAYALPDAELPLPHAVLMASALSAYPADDLAAAGFTARAREHLLDDLWERRLAVPRPLQAHLALALHRADRRAGAREVWAALMDAAKTDPDLGVFWAPEDRAWLWYHDTVEGHAFALRVAAEVAPDDPRRAGLAQWLLLNKHLGQWKSTRTTAEALYALVHHLQDEGALGRRDTVRVRVGDRARTFTTDPDDPTAGHAHLVLAGEEIDGPTMSTVLVARESPGLAFASATWHFSTDRPVTAADGDFLAVTRQFFLRRVADGRDVLVPLREGDQVAVGDRIEVQLQVRARAAAEYVHLRDPRAAGCEPESTASGHRRDRGLGYYEEVRDSGANYFFAQLPAGEYTLRHRLRVATAGAFRVQPAVLQCLYAPEFAAHSAGGRLVVDAAAR